MASKPPLRLLAPASVGWGGAGSFQPGSGSGSEEDPHAAHSAEPYRYTPPFSEPGPFERPHPGAHKPLAFERRIRLLCAALLAPGFLLSWLLLWRAGMAWTSILGILGFLAFMYLIIMGALLEQIVRPLQTFANVVASLREGDYSFRARSSRKTDSLGELAQEINQLADMLQNQRFSEMEAAALLRNVVRSMDSPVLAFDRTNTLRLINPAAERLLDVASERVLGRSASDLDLGTILDQPDQGVLTFGGKRNAARWMVRRSSFRQRGLPHTLLMLSDVSAALREQEREAWQRLIRVLGHEINNSLTPIKSIAGSLRSRLQSHAATDSADLDRALKIIESRADSLNRFIQAYRQLAQLPSPALSRVSLRPLLERVAALETRVRISLEPGPDPLLDMDPDQMEQLMINLIRNAAEASLSRASESSSSASHHYPPPEVRLSWRVSADFVEISVIDNGTGLLNPSNLFVPFYTTKVGGSGVGLALARQICEAHGGTIQLSNRPDGLGCQAQVRLPLRPGILRPEAVS